MPNTFFDGTKVKRWFNDDLKVKKAFFDSALVFQDEYVLNITANNHNCPTDYVWNMLPADIKAAAGTIRIIVASGVQLVGGTTATPVLDFHSAWQGKTVIVENYGTILGRGGGGGHEGQGGGGGGRAIYHGNSLVSLSINNQGTIGGGGGGGGGSVLGASYGGGGGAPFGPGGWGSGASGNAASYGTPGAGLSWAGKVSGAGGAWGAAGASGNGGGGGPAGAATQGPINWINVGTIYGARI